MYLCMSEFACVCVVPHLIVPQCCYKEVVVERRPISFVVEQAHTCITPFSYTCAFMYVCMSMCVRVHVWMITEASRKIRCFAITATVHE